VRQETSAALLSAVLTAIIATSLAGGIQEMSAKVTAVLLPAAISGSLAILLLVAVRRHRLKARKVTKD
jgi:hypothetical protein